VKLIDLRERVAVVTGAGQGVGRACAIQFAQAGAHLVLTDVKAAALKQVRGEIEDLGVRAVDVPGDVSVKADVDKVIHSALAAFGRVDILVNNAGICPVVKYYDVSEADWARVLDINLKGVFLYCQAVAPIMTRQKSGAIVNISSMGVWTGGISASAPYVASKAGIIGITHHFARYLATDGIRVNAVAPGIIDTDMTAGWDEGVKEQLRKAIPLGRFGTAEEVAQVVLFLASDLSSYVTGTTVSITGGFLLD
jgi:3-oxoacyl-[acyl-carrier protein] reductase